jgi:hypothetical protein
MTGLPGKPESRKKRIVDPVGMLSVFMFNELRLLVDY